MTNATSFRLASFAAAMAVTASLLCGVAGLAHASARSATVPAAAAATAVAVQA